MSKADEIKQKRNSGRGFFEAIHEDAQLVAESQNAQDGNIAILQYGNNAITEEQAPAAPAPAYIPTVPEISEEKPKTGKMKSYLEKNSGVTLTTIRMPVEIHEGLAEYKYKTKRKGDRVINELLALFLDIYKDNKLSKKVDDADSFYDAVMKAMQK